MQNSIFFGSLSAQAISVSDKANDASCCLDSAIGTLYVLADRLEGDNSSVSAIYGVVRLIKSAKQFVDGKEIRQ